MRRPFNYTLTLILVALALAACSTPQVTGVVAVEIAGGDRQMPLDATLVLGANVTAGSGLSTAVTWESSEESVAVIDAQGVLTAVGPGESTITATSAADSTMTDSIVVTVIVDDAAARSFAATYVPVDPAFPPVLGVSFGVGGPELLGPASFTEVDPGLHLGPVAPVGADGSVEVTLPAPADIPANVLQDVTAMFPALENAPDCSLTASAAATQATPVLFQLITVPGVFLVTFDGFIPAFMSDSGTNPLTVPAEDLDTWTVYTYIYADGPTSVASTGTDCTVPGIDAPFVFDLDLVEGWNEIAVTIDFGAPNDPELVTMTNGAAPELFIHPLFF